VNLATFPLWLFLIALMIAPQLWFGPVLDLRVDLLIYPLWLMVLTARGRIVEVFRLSTHDWVLLAMLVWFMLSHLANGSNPNGATQLADYAKWFLLYRMIVASIDSPKNLHRAALVFLAMALVLTVEGVQHKLSAEGLGWANQPFAWTDPSAAAIGLETRTRWVGIFDGPGVFCVIYTVALPFALRYATTAHAVFKRVVAAGLVVPGLLLATYYTGSRGGMLTAMAIVGLFIASRFRINFRKLVLFGLLGLAVMSLAPAYLTSTKDESHSAQNRVTVWAKGFGMAADNPLLGVGKGNFRMHTGTLVAHNSGIEILGETGFPGLFLWFTVLYLALKQLWERYFASADAQERELLLALGLSLVGYFISSLFVTLEYETYYCLLALAASVRNWSDPSVRLTRRDCWILLAFMAVFVGGFRTFVMSYW
jgi:O-antigen ligase